MRGEELLEQVYDWLAAKHPDGPEWNRSGFDCFSDCHPLVRAIVAMDTVEGEVSNGAWGQLLWNTFPNWREVVSLARSGYEMMGAHEQVLAIDALALKLTEHEAACGAAMERASDADFGKEFGQFTAIGYADAKFKAQLAFTDESLQEKRCAWLSRCATEVQSALAA
jgi:hypothetical protein